MFEDQIFPMIKDWGSSAAVIICIILFLKQLNAMQTSWNELVQKHLDNVSCAIKEAAQITATAVSKLADEFHEGKNA